MLNSPSAELAAAWAAGRANATAGASNAAAPAGVARLVAERLSDRLAAVLCSQIDAGTLQPGGRLPTEQQLALAYGVSRTVVREAVHQLKSRQLVVSRQGSGVFVAPPPVNLSLAFDPSVLQSVQSFVHVVEVRRALEAEIAALAAERATRAQVAAMRRKLKAIDVAVADGRDGVEEDLSFHASIGEATGNPQFRLLLDFLEQYLREGMRITRGNEARRSDFMEAVRREHRAIFDAVVARDPSAARQRAREHLMNSEQRLVEGRVLARPRRKVSQP